MNFRVKNIEFSYPGVSVLKDVSIELAPGQILAIVGRNGAGKTTLIKCMNRILEPVKGKVYLDGMDMGKMHLKEIARSLAYLSQSSGYTFPITVFDAVLSGRYPHRAWFNEAKDQDKIIEVLKLMDLEDLSMRYFNELSGGQQQRVLIARAVAQEASIMLLDEPTGGLDIKHQLEVMNTVRSLAGEREVSVIMSIHDLNLASRYADRVVLLERGSVFAAGSPAEVLTEDNIAEAYGVRVHVEYLAGKPHIIPMHPVSAANNTELLNMTF
ncbi:MAG: ATP-binding cassette domain-containing protein [Candidatus Omnitrophica bacterium]|nr:ATP-binding cassette domain-containing protein [Candidatus Omnitrophota bacterium]